MSTTAITDAVLGRISAACGDTPTYQMGAAEGASGLYVISRVTIRNIPGSRVRFVDVAVDFYGRIDQTSQVQGLADAVDNTLCGWASSVDGFLGPFSSGTIQAVPQDQVDPGQVRYTASFTARWVSLSKTTAEEGV